MSYILDALRRAESERERERSAVPTLHAQTVAAHLNQQDDEEAGHAGWARWRLAAVALLVLGALALLGFGLRSWLSAPPPLATPAAEGVAGNTAAPNSMPAPAAPAIPAVPAMPPPLPADSVNAPAPQTAPQAAVAAAPTAPAALPSQSPMPMPPARNMQPAAAAVLQAPVLAQPSVAPAMLAPPAQAKPQPINPKPEPFASPALAPAVLPPANAAPPALASLPESLRRELPPLVAGGAMYSDTPANRMLIINGQLWHEGDKVTPDVTLEQIKLKGAILSYKGQRFSINF
nr:general secretion pathway protein GspB [uncultured Roseateles sp.]